MHFALRHF